MSIPDSNSSASVTVSPSLSTASATPARPVNTNTPPSPSYPPPAQPPPPPSQPSPVPPPPTPPTYRPVVHLRHPVPLQQAHNNLYAQSIPNLRPNQDPSAVLYPFAPPGRGREFSARTVRGFVADQSGYPPRPGMVYNHLQYGPAQIESMMQYMKESRPQIPQLPRLGAGSPVVSGPRRGSPQFLQPRVAPPRASILDTSSNRKARSRDGALVLIRGRKVRITEGASLYSLGRSWLKNGSHVGIQSQRTGIMKSLPKPLPVDMTETSGPDDPADEDVVDEEAVEELTEKDLLKGHIERAKKIRARLKEERLRKIKRYKERIALLLPQSEE
ncbi:PREDICTED: proline-rich receptor-like protein kinase PERK9 isoform X1 [Camelina sativa]|uniref:Proline-rich receptor-like protein kinase PERK9 isoform X1 n=1 Tax=Camelina sativa TaxID=90675 RepID=A0ABM0XDR8_CAMSA|nr:PREDICTED: proline-rich receptor-like protein kinase PERK9 isoform X1 [Camelina sativa]